MIATRQKLPDLPIERLHADEVCHDANIYPGDVLGYRCRECGQADETLHHIIHKEDCELAGEHGREIYDELPRIDLEAESRELSAEHPITVVTAAWTDCPADVSSNQEILFLCRQCGNADENLFEIVHDERCGLATEDRDTIAEMMSDLARHPVAVGE